MSGQTAATTIGGFRGRLRGWIGTLWRLEAQLKGVQFRGTATFYGRPLISVASGGTIIIGKNVLVHSAVASNPLGCFQPSVLRAMYSGARLEIGDGVGLSGTVLCAAKAIEIGEGTIFGSGAMVLDNDFHEPGPGWSWPGDHGRTARPVKIGRGVFVGARSLILKGLTIGDRAVIGAAAVVTADVPPGGRVAGNPARLIESRQAQDPR